MKILVATEDGSLGHHGDVVELLRATLEARAGDAKAVETLKKAVKNKGFYRLGGRTHG